MTDYGKVRVATMYDGLVCINQFDAVEIERMVTHPQAPDELVPAEGEAGEIAIAVSVRLHYRRGGVETVFDFRFDPATPGAEESASQAADQLAFSLADMILMSDETLTSEYVLGRQMAADERAAWVKSAEADQLLEDGDRSVASSRM